MPTDQAQKLKRLYDEMVTRRANWLNLWQEIADYMIPWRPNVFQRIHPGTKTTDLIFDSTAQQALVTASSALHGSVTPSTQRWFSFITPDPLLMQEEGVPQWLDLASTITWMAFSSSNFDSEAQEIYSDLLGFGTGCMVVDEDDSGDPGLFSGIVFRTEQPGTFVIKEGANGRVNTVIREFDRTVAAVVERWGVESVSESVRRLYEQGNYEHVLRILHYVGPREEDAFLSRDAPKGKPIASIYMELSDSPNSSDSAHRARLHILKESGEDEMPIAVVRWRKVSGEDYGRGPGSVVLPDVRTLNRAVELRLKAWSLAVAPVIMTTDRGVIGNIRLEPFGRIHVRPGATVETLDIPSRFDVANFQETQLQNSIKNGFFVDLLQFNSKDGNPITATEASIRFQTMQRILGPVVSRLQSEFLAPVVMRVFRILARRGAFPDPPPALRESSLELVFEGPLARVQRAGNIESISQFFQLLFPILEVDRGALDRVDFNEVIEGLAQDTLLPMRMLRSREAAAEITRAKVEAEQQQLQAAQLLEASKVLQSGPGSSPAPV